MNPILVIDDSVIMRKIILRHLAQAIALGPRGYIRKPFTVVGIKAIIAPCSRRNWLFPQLTIS